MKELILIRHAKSSWKFPDLPDFERPLNKRGKRDAPFIGDVLFKRIGTPDFIISSPATRAFSTAKKLSRSLNYPIDKIKKDIKIYLAEEVELLKIIKKLSDKYQKVILIGHNPGLTDLFNMLCHKTIENIPTCGSLHLKFTQDSWENIIRKTGEMTFFEYPKKYFVKEENTSENQ
ncbi:MAG TPA: histidine phosphatase family protein [Cytophagales bacterium]|nr:histidine phosphatase family protein [Cytophagales bacterium]